MTHAKRLRSDMTPEERKAAQRRQKHMEYKASIGEGFFADPAPAMGHVRSLMDAGMYAQTIADEAGCAVMTVRNLYHGVRHSRGIEVHTIERSIRTRILAVELRVEWVHPIASIRRVQGLAMNGFPLRFQAQELGISLQYLHKLVHDTPPTMGIARATQIELVYNKLYTADPSDYGIPKRSQDICIKSATRNKFAPSQCWDDDTIGDSNAIPEWTGACGTKAGWEIHAREGIPQCDPCNAAHEEDRASHVLEGLNVELRTAYCTGCAAQVDVVLHGSSCSRGPRYRCGPRMRALRLLRIARKKGFQDAIDRLTDEGKSTAEIATLLGVTTRTVTRRRARTGEFADA